MLGTGFVGATVFLHPHTGDLWVGLGVTLSPRQDALLLFGFFQTWQAIHFQFLHCGPLGFAALAFYRIFAYAGIKA